MRWALPLAALVLVASPAAAAPLDALFDVKGMSWTQAIHADVAEIVGLGCLDTCTAPAHIGTGRARLEVWTYPVAVVQAGLQNVTLDLQPRLLESVELADSEVGVFPNRPEATILVVPTQGTWTVRGLDLPPQAWVPQGKAVGISVGSPINPQGDGGSLLPPLEAGRGETPAAVRDPLGGTLLATGAWVRLADGRAWQTGWVPRATGPTGQIADRLVIVAHSDAWRVPALSPWVSHLEGRLDGEATFEAVDLDAAINGSSLQTASSISSAAGAFHVDARRSSGG